MVTGVETAGLVLATFPLVIKVLEHYGSCVESMKEWVRFRAEFTIFMNSLYRQKIFFRQNIEDLLSSVIDSEYDMARMLDDPNDPVWKDPELEVRLKRRLSGQYEYECYMDSVSSFHETLMKLESKLRPPSDQPSWLHLPGITSILGNEYRRLTYTVNKKRRQKLMSQLDKSNEDMKSLLGNSDRLAPVRKKRLNHLPKIFRQFRIQAASLHSAITRALQCDCLTPHSAGLLLSRADAKLSEYSTVRDPPELMKLNLFFPLDSGRWSSTSTLVHSPDTRYAAEAHMIIDNTLESDASTLFSDNASIFHDHGEKNPDQRPRKVSFQSSTSHGLNPSWITDLVRILDMCATLQKIDEHQPYLGILQDGHERYHVVRTVPNSALSAFQTDHMVTLDSLLSGQYAQNKRPEAPSSSLILRRPKRLRIGLALASALLQLYPGPWLKHEWSKKDIYFFQSSDGNIDTSYPIIVGNFLAKKPSSTPETTANRPSTIVYQQTRISLLCLGIVIMELWFGQVIESLPFRTQFLGPDGIENEFTDFNTAQKWQEQMLEEGGLELHNITRRCIYCAFGAASQDLNDEELRRAVYDEVVGGLERIIARYEEGWSAR
ncbi:hypothetical protein PRK78_002589 [Emydomyces testavorans]|uniref:DUF7580 domain-containing protein n=1 Tax=Emydomyces testavorans TaxID=2070801 RepID=A0AAF0DEL2_9EURO|nr:hypothetical protein PRK78_002589 [Emydomyces testavorans]